MTTESLGDEFSTLMKEAMLRRGFTLAALHQALRDHGEEISLTALSYWRSGQRRPESPQSFVVLDRLEHVLGFAPGELSEAVRRPARVGRVTPLTMPFDDERIAREVRETMADLSPAPQGTLREVSAHVVAYVDREGNPTRVTTRYFAKATGGVVHAIPLVGIAARETELIPELVDLVGVSVAKFSQHSGGLATGHLLEFDEPVGVGETVVFEVTKVLPLGFPSDRAVWHGLMTRSKALTVWLRFAPGAEPAWCEEYEEAGGEEQTWPLELVNGSAQVARFGFGPAVIGVRWGYEDER